MAKKTYEPKEYVWTLDIDNEDRIFKCLVTDTECITYEGDVEKKHLKIMNPVRKNKVLQIDTVTVVYGQMVPFQLENGIPYIQMEGKWKMSDTNRQDRIAQSVRVNKLSAYIEIGIGMVLTLGYLAVYWLFGTMGKLWFISIMGVMLVIAGVSNLSRLKAEMELLQEAEAELAEEKAEARKAALNMQTAHNDTENG